MAKRISIPQPVVVKPKEKGPFSNEDDDMLTNDFEIESDDEFDIICNFVFILPIELDIMNEVSEARMITLLKK